MQYSALFDKLSSLEYQETEDGKRCDLPFEATAFEIDPVSSTFDSGQYEIRTWAGDFIVTRFPAIVGDASGKYYHSIEFTEGSTTAFDVECLLAYLSQDGFI